MMWPILTKVQYERLPAVFSTPNIWQQLALSILLNWLIAPFIMLGLAWLTLPERNLASERQGVVLIGIARCIGEYLAV
jgi:arsenite transporter